MTRAVAATFKTKETREGAGVRLHRGFSNVEAKQFDPFLLFDDFSSDIPEHYLAGFPWHPHRGMETVTYILDGAVRHKDSLGNEGVIESGAVQRMTAGSGIIHEEMPESAHVIRGFQLWVNLPKEKKMSPPKYQDMKGKIIPEVTLGSKAHARVISESPLYMDVTLEANGEVSIPLTSGHTAFAYIIEGALGVEAEEPTYYTSGAEIFNERSDYKNPSEVVYSQASTIVLFEHEGNTVALRAPAAGARFLLIAGAPLNEPIAWHGPIVMNTDEELRQAFIDLREGSFIRKSLV